MVSLAGNGKKHSKMLNYLHDTPYIRDSFALRELKKIYSGWTACNGLVGMEDWAGSPAGH